VARIAPNARETGVEARGRALEQLDEPAVDEDERAGHRRRGVAGMGVPDDRVDRRGVEARGRPADLERAFERRWRGGGILAAPGDRPGADPDERGILPSHGSRR
jgi:hypothetical protein